MGFALVGVVVASLYAAKVGAKCMHLYGAPESTRFKAKGKPAAPQVILSCLEILW